MKHTDTATPDTATPAPNSLHALADWAARCIRLRARCAAGERALEGDIRFISECSERKHRLGRALASVPKNAKVAKEFRAFKESTAAFAATLVDFRSSLNECEAEARRLREKLANPAVSCTQLLLSVGIAPTPARAHLDRAYRSYMEAGDDHFVALHQMARPAGLLDLMEKTVPLAIAAAGRPTMALPSPTPASPEKNKYLKEV